MVDDAQKVPLPDPGMDASSQVQPSGKSRREKMIYQISYIPHGSRLMESPENIEFVADRYCELTRKNALKIELCVEGMPLDPQLLLSASPDWKYFRPGVFAPRQN